MALRIRCDGRIYCAAIAAQEIGDTYVDDNLHYEMSVVHKVIVTRPMPEHMETGQWWWRSQVPHGVQIDSFYGTPVEDVKSVHINGAEIPQSEDTVYLGGQEAGPDSNE